MDENMNPFGEERIMPPWRPGRTGRWTRWLKASGRYPVLRGGAEQYDDMTFLFLRVE